MNPAPVAILAAAYWWLSRDLNHNPPRRRAPTAHDLTQRAAQLSLDAHGPSATPEARARYRAALDEALHARAAAGDVRTLPGFEDLAAAPAKGKSVQRGFFGLLENPSETMDIPKDVAAALIDRRREEYLVRKYWTDWNSYKTFKEAVQKTRSLDGLHNAWDRYLDAETMYRRHVTPEVLRHFEALRKHRAAGGEIGPNATAVLKLWPMWSTTGLRPIPSFPFKSYGKTYEDFGKLHEWVGYSRWYFDKQRAPWERDFLH